jgi:hypothetical protein
MAFILGVTITMLVGVIAPPMEVVLTNTDKVLHECKNSTTHICSRVRINNKGGQ